MCGTKSKTSTRNASRVTRRVGRRRIRRASRKRGECDGPWKCAAPARQRQTRVRNAAIGWTIRMDESDFRVLEGRLKSPPVLSILSAGIRLATTEQAETISRQLLTASVSHMDIGTLIALAIAKYTIVDSFKGRKWDSLNDRGGYA
jgi:hypothetical protein